MNSHISTASQADATVSLPQQSVPAKEPATPIVAVRLSDTGRVLLSRAANREDGSVLPSPPSLRTRGAALARILQSLLTVGLIEEVAGVAEQQAWRHDETHPRVGLRITSAGLNMIGLPALAPEPTNDRLPADAAPTSPSPQPAAPPLPAASAALPSLSATPSPSATPSVSPASPRSASPSSALASNPSLRRRPTKQDRLIDMLSRGEGCTVTELTVTFGWLPHTVRAALTGLRRKGFVLTRSKNEAGTTIYRLSPAPVANAVPTEDHTDRAAA
jgi:hypothetical protein